MSEIQNNRTTRHDKYEQVARTLGEQFSYGLTPTEAVDYLAVEKADIPTGEWAEVRNVSHSTISGNVSRGKNKINESRLDAEVSDEKTQVVVSITGDDDQQWDLVFDKEASPVGYDSTAELQLVYEAMGAVHGYFADQSGNEFESTLWFDGRRTNAFEEFDFNDEWGTPEAKADTILWRKESN